MSQINQQQYGDDDIKQLKGADRIRKRPASMLGSSDLPGARHGFTEISGNALDEVSAGYGDKLEVTYYEDGAMSLRDYGRGVPLGWNNTEATYNWHIIYNELYGGGKYNNHQEKLQAITDWSQFNEKLFNYLYSVGLNGLGAASTQYTSEYFIVRSVRNGICTEMHFERGLPIINGRPINVFREPFDMSTFVPNEYKVDEPDGTFIKWKPDDTVFTNVNVGGDWLYEACEDIAFVAHVDLVFKDEQTGFEKTIPAGDLADLVMAKFRKKLVLDESSSEPNLFRCNSFRHGTITLEGKPFVWVCKADICFTPVKDRVNTFCYHNSVKKLGGSQFNGVSSAVSKFFTTIASQQGLKLESSDYDKVLGFAVSSYSNYASVKGQTKEEIDNSFILEIVRDTILEKLNIEYGKGNKVLLGVIEDVMQEARNRIAARELAKQVREINKASKTAKDPEKFATCKEYERKDYSRTELWITEGDSAKGAVVDARDSDYQAVFPIRGKALNVLKCGMDKILQNDEIKGIFALLGTGMDVDLNGDNPFDIGGLKFDKIIFATDADEDGFQIRVLLFLIFYKLAPELLRQGKIFVAETPRFALKMNDGTVLYARTDIERDEIKEQNRARFSSMSRFKGLGEVDKEILRETTVHPDTRTLVPINVDVNDENARQVINALFGTDKYKERKSILTTVLGEDVAEMMAENALLLDSIENSNIDDGVDYQVV